jgi:hypothetical protein
MNVIAVFLNAADEQTEYIAAETGNVADER